MPKVCDACEYLKAPTNLILETKHWVVGVGNDQPYLGRAYCNLKTHRTSLGELTPEEWKELQHVFSELERKYKTAFGAEMMNVECNMNHAFKEQPYNPHVHWHIYPRYRQPVKVGGLVFDDPLFGSHIDENLVRIVDDSVVSEIVAKLEG